MLFSPSFSSAAVLSLRAGEFGNLWDETLLYISFLTLLFARLCIVLSQSEKRCTGILLHYFFSTRGDLSTIRGTSLTRMLNDV